GETQAFRPEGSCPHWAGAWARRWRPSGIFRLVVRRSFLLLLFLRYRGRRRRSDQMRKSQRARIHGVVSDERHTCGVKRERGIHAHVALVIYRLHIPQLVGLSRVLERAGSGVVV